MLKSLRPTSPVRTVSRPDVLIVNELSHITKQEFAENLMDNAAKCRTVWLQSQRTLASWARGNTSGESWPALPTAGHSTNGHNRLRGWIQAEMDEAKLRNSTARYLRLWHGVWASGAGDALDAADIEAAIMLPPIAAFTCAGPLCSHPSHVAVMSPGSTWELKTIIRRWLCWAATVGRNAFAWHNVNRGHRAWSVRWT